MEENLFMISAKISWLISVSGHFGPHLQRSHIRSVKLCVQKMYVGVLHAVYRYYECNWLHVKKCRPSLNEDLCSPSFSLVHIPKFILVTKTDMTLEIGEMADGSAFEQL